MSPTQKRRSARVSVGFFTWRLGMATCWRSARFSRAKSQGYLRVEQRAEARDPRRSILTSRPQVNRVQSSYSLKSRLGPAEKHAPVIFADRAVIAMNDRAPLLKVPWAHLEPREKQTKLDGRVQPHDPRKAQDPARRRRQELGRVYLYSASAWRYDFLHHRGRDDLSFPANVYRNASTGNQRIPVPRPFIKRPNAPLKPSVRHFNCGPASRRLCYQQEPKCGT